MMRWGRTWGTTSPILRKKQGNCRGGNRMKWLKPEYLVFSSSKKMRISTLDWFFSILLALSELMEKKRVKKTSPRAVHHYCRTCCSSLFSSHSWTQRWKCICVADHEFCRLRTFLHQTNYRAQSLLENRNVHFLNMKNGPREVFAWTWPQPPWLPRSLWGPRQTRSMWGGPRRDLFWWRQESPRVDEVHFLNSQKLLIWSTITFFHFNCPPWSSWLDTGLPCNRLGFNSHQWH
jgi:hypothetical protein